MKHTEHILHIAKLNNNCPECYGTNGLEISFAQKEMENRFYKKIEKQISETLYCHNCKTVIYPVNWTAEIDQVYQYNKKQAVSKNTGIRLKSISYLLILLPIILIAALLYAVNY